MHLPVRFSLFSAVLVAGLLVAGPCANGQVQPSAKPSTASQTTGNGTYITVDPLANVHYDNRWDVSVGVAYDHIKAGPTVLQGANLGGLDLSASYWFSRRWGLEGSGRGYVGTSGANPNTFIDGNGNPDSIQGPFVAQYLFVGGPEWLGPHNKHGALIAHALFGGAYGDFERDLRGQSPALVGFYNNQMAPAAIIGGHIDLNRSAQWVFRITPDAVITRYGINYGSKYTQTDVNFAISVGVEYRFKSKRR
jgi:hypothetical protein